MNRRLAVTLLAAFPLGSYAQSLGSIASALKDPLLQVLMSQLGVTEKQAKGGVGSYLTLLREKLPKADFNTVAALVPGASGYLETAKKLGAVVGPLKNLAGLNGALGRLGMGPATATKFTPALTDYLGKLGGAEIQSLLAVAMK